jgi:hypothetical protein
MSKSMLIGVAIFAWHFAVVAFAICDRRGGRTKPAP